MEELGQSSQVDSLAMPDRRKMSIRLMIGILLVPGIFSWFTLKRGYGKAARIISLSWMTLVMSFWLLIILAPKDGGGAAGPADNESAEVKASESAEQGGPALNRVGQAGNSGLAFDQTELRHLSKCQAANQYIVNNLQYNIDNGNDVGGKLIAQISMGQHWTVIYTILETDILKNYTDRGGSVSTDMLKIASEFADDLKTRLRDAGSDQDNNREIFDYTDKVRMNECNISKENKEYISDIMQKRSDLYNSVGKSLFEGKWRNQIQ